MNFDRLKTIKEADVEGKKVFCRLDFDVPLDEAGNILDQRRIELCLPTIDYLLRAGAEKIILAWKLGRPQQQETRLKTDKTAAKASQMLDHDIDKIDGWSQRQVEVSSERIVALENLRFHPGEQASSDAKKREFASQLANLADIYVNEAFACSHRNDASLSIMPQYLPSFLGLRVKQELDAIKKLRNPQKPLVVILGGKKSEKLTALFELKDEADKMLVGGVPANTLLQAKGYDLQESPVNEKSSEQAEKLVKNIETGKREVGQLRLPQDLIVADAKTDDVREVAVDQMPSGYSAFDIGSRTITAFCREINQAASIIWSGVPGRFESDEFAQGTKELARSIAESSALSVAGGGETALALKKFNCIRQLDFVSSGGGAFLSLLIGRDLPGLRAIYNSQEVKDELK